MPNVFLALARRPDEFRAFFAFHATLMDSDTGLSKAERELIVVATSAVNQCLYCVVAHGAILRIPAAAITYDASNNVSLITTGSAEIGATGAAPASATAARRAVSAST